MFVKKSNGNFSVKAWQGDAKTLLAFNFDNKPEKLAGFTIMAQPHGQQGYFLLNSLSFPSVALNSGTTLNTSDISPFQKFRWLHVPGSFHQNQDVFFGVYTYTVTPRFFDEHGGLVAMNASIAVVIDVLVQPFVSGNVELGFTRGFVQSQAFAHRFGVNAKFKPTGADLLFDTSAVAGTNPAGQTFTYSQEYQWCGFTARNKIFDILNAVVADSSLKLDVFAYDCSEPDVLKLFLKLASQGRIRVILDNASLHTGDAPEQVFFTRFSQVAPDAIKRGHFSRYAHDKVFIVYQDAKPVKVLTGSTNYSVTGMYVNSNHVLVFNNTDVAQAYSNVFSQVWNENVSESFSNSPLANSPTTFNQLGLPKMSITFSPHTSDVANGILTDIAARINSAKSVLFAVMQVEPGGGAVLNALKAVHANQDIFSYGISDSPGNENISLYKPGSINGVLVTGKPQNPLLPPPFDKEASVGIGHQIHHKFVVCDFNTNNAVIYGGSSNLAEGGEEENGDNLLQIHDTDIATVFALEALALVDHFDFRNANETAKSGTRKPSKAPKGGSQSAVTPAPQPPAALNLFTNSDWVERYFDPSDLHCVDRELFG